MKMAFAASVLAASLAFTTTHIGSAHADDFKFSFDTGAVRFAFKDGYWDREHHWHKWANTREREEYRHRYADHYQAYEHNRVKNEGWRDDDRR